MKAKLIILGCLITLAVYAQEEELQAVEAFSEDYTYELIADRLSCIEGEVPLEFNNRVYGFINYFIVKNRPYVRDVMQKSTLYFPVMEEMLAKYGLPDELKYLSIVESGLNPQAVSRAGAGGLWQFMPYTGRSYGLHQDWYIDERFDPYLATEAACKYLGMLYRMFGDWELALAAYNSGPGNVRKAIRRSGYKKSFWEIYNYLPRETRSYVPQFVAVMYAFKYGEEHNLFIEEYKYLPASDTIMVKGFMNLQLLAENLDVCYDELKLLNPGLKRIGVKTENSFYPVQIPIDKLDFYRLNKDAIVANTAEIGLAELEYQARNSVGSTFGRDKIVYRVQSGDVLGTIAERYKVRVTDIKNWNNLSSNLIRVNQKLDIWVYPGTKVAQTPVTKTKIDPVTIDYSGRKVYTVQPGDTLWDIAKKYPGLDIEKIKTLNNLKDAKIMPGQKLIIG